MVSFKTEANKKAKLVFFSKRLSVYAKLVALTFCLLLQLPCTIVASLIKEEAWEWAPYNETSDADFIVSNNSFNASVSFDIDVFTAPSSTLIVDPWTVKVQSSLNQVGFKGTVLSPNDPFVKKMGAATVLFHESMPITQFKKEAQEELAKTYSMRPKHLASGILVEDGKYIITNSHVVDGIKKDNFPFVVGIAGNRFKEADLVGSDLLTDIAVLKFKDEEELPSAPFAASLKGEKEAFLIHNLGGYNKDLNEYLGFISTKGAIDEGFFTPFDACGKFYNSPLEGLAAHLASRPGDSGAAIFNKKGEIIGILLGGASGLPYHLRYLRGLFSYCLPSYAMSTQFISIDNVRTVFEQIKAQGSIKRGSLGAILKATERGGLMVYKLLDKNGPLAKAGVKLKDIISAINNKKVTHLNWDFRSLIDNNIGQSIKLDIIQCIDEEKALFAEHPKKVIVNVDIMTESPLFFK